MNGSADLPKSNFVRHEDCPDCGSSDARSYYDDGHYFCFSCQTHTQEEPGGAANDDAAQPVPNQGKTKRKDLLQGRFQTLEARRLCEDDCRKFDYSVATYQGEVVQVATYRDKSGRPVAQKIRTKDKKFIWLGEPKKAQLYGSHIWSTGKMLVITEGELDCITASKVQGHKWATVSLPNGAASAAKAMTDHWDYLMNFETIVLLFDSDEAGMKAAQAAAEVLPIGRCKIAQLPAKDANQCLVDGQGGEIINSIFQARDYRPDGLVEAQEYRDTIGIDEAASALEYPYSLLQEITRGVHPGTLVTLTAGSGIGKSTLVRELAHHFHVGGNQVGMIMLEESNKRTLQGLVGIFMSKNITVDRSDVDDDEITAAFDLLFGPDMPPLYCYDHWGSSDIDNICAKIRQMAQMGAKVIFLDHISILISGQAFGNNERTLIDTSMTKLRSLVAEIGCSLVLVSHLRRPDGNQGHEDGAQVRLGQLRGSHSIAQLSDICISMSVDPDEPDSDIRHLAVLKNRYTGQTGPAGTLHYNRETGRLIEDVLAQLTPVEDDEATEQGDETNVDN